MLGLTYVLSMGINQDMLSSGAIFGFLASSFMLKASLPGILHDK